MDLPAQSARRFLRPLFWTLAALAVTATAFYYLRFDWLGYRILREYNASLSASAPPAAAVFTSDVIVPGSGAPTDARLYLPPHAAHPPGIVLVHGMTDRGIDEPRLIDFSRVLARNGFAVLTPGLVSLADFRIDPHAVEAIGDSAVWLQRRLQSGPVAVLGLSFAGGLSLLAAANPAFAPHIRVVISVGGYDNLSRVGRFLITGQTVTPAGAVVRLRPNDYGAVIYVAIHPNEFFPAAEATAAGTTLEDWLQERPRAAAADLARLSPPERAFLQDLFNDRIAEIRPRLLAVLAANQSQMDALSPAGKLASLRVPVFLLHAAGDNVIPWTELLWLRRDVPAPDLRNSLLTTAMDHVDPNLSGWRSALQLVRFFATALHAAD